MCLHFADTSYFSIRENLLIHLAHLVVMMIFLIIYVMYGNSTLVNRTTALVFYCTPEVILQCLLQKRIHCGAQSKTKEYLEPPKSPYICGMSKDLSFNWYVVCHFLTLLWKNSLLMKNSNIVSVVCQVSYQYSLDARYCIPPEFFSHSLVRTKVKPQSNRMCVAPIFVQLFCTRIGWRFVWVLLFCFQVCSFISGGVGCWISTAVWMW